MSCPRLLAISQSSGRPGASIEEVVRWARDLADAGVDAIQIRDKELTDRQLLELVRRVRAAVRPPCRLLVNGRADIAVAANADGVHLPSSGVPVGAVRSRFGPAFVIGRSTHHISEIERAGAGGADYVTFGPVYATPGKEIYGPPQGLDALERAVATGVPVVAIGGVTMDRMADLSAAGARGAAAIRLFASTERSAEVVAAARHRFQ